MSDRWRSKVWGAYNPQKGVVLFTHGGCPYVCRYIWSGYAGTTINRLFDFCIYSVPEVGSMNIQSLGGIRPRKRVVLLTHAVCPYICHLYCLAIPAPRPVRNINNFLFLLNRFIWLEVNY